MRVQLKTKQRAITDIDRKEELDDMQKTWIDKNLENKRALDQ